MEYKTFIVGALGLKPSEVSVLKTLFSLHGGRSWYYRVIEGIHEEVPDILLVDRENIFAVGNWTRMLTTKPNIPSVSIYTKPRLSAAKTEEYSFQRPLRMQHLVKAMDDIVLRHLNFVPPISDDTYVDRAMLKVETEVAAGRATALRPTGYRALVVDDSSTIRALMEASLRGIGIQPELVDGADAALERLRDQAYDIIFLDIVMPGMMDGYRLCKLIKSGEKTRKTPVILLTSKDSTLDKVRGKFSGADAYLTKPVDQSELLSAIGKFLTHVGERY